MESASIKIERAQRRVGGPGVLGYLLIALLVATSLAIYLTAAQGLASRGTWFVIGEASGIAAAVLLAIAVILTGRLLVLEWLFGDLTRVYVAHAIVGMTMFALVSVHPLLYVTGTLDAGAGAAAHVIVPFHLVALDWASYLLIGAALVLTLYIRLPFATWRLTHMLLGVAMVVTGYSILIENHAFDTVKIPGLRIFLFVLYGLGAAVFLWVAVIQRLMWPKREYEVHEVIRHDAANAVELRARPGGKRIEFTAGEFVAVDLIDDRLPVSRDFEGHPYSIVTAPDEEEIGLVIEARGEHTTRIQQMTAGDRAWALLHTPHGRIGVERPRRKKQIWVGGGIGITPFLSMAAELAAHPERYEGYEITLVAGVDHPEQAFYLDRLRRAEERHPGLRVHVWNREEKGLPTAAGIAELVDADPAEYAVMLSGPEAMIADLENQFREIGVPHPQIRWQREIGPPEHWRAAAPTMRRLRVITTVTFSLFAVLVVASTVGRALFA